MSCQLVILVLYLVLYIGDAELPDLLTGAIFIQRPAEYDSRLRAAVELCVPYVSLM